MPENMIKGIIVLISIIIFIYVFICITFGIGLRGLKLDPETKRPILNNAKKISIVMSILSIIDIILVLILKFTY